MDYCLENIFLFYLNLTKDNLSKAEFQQHLALLL